VREGVNMGLGLSCPSLHTLMLSPVVIDCGHFEPLTWRLDSGGVRPRFGYALSDLNQTALIEHEHDVATLKCA